MNDRGQFFGGSRLLGSEDRLELRTVGVDVGSATTHLAFSLLVAERVGGRYVVTDHVLLYESRIALTPYSDPRTIDGKALSAFVQEEYQAAGIGREQVDTGVVILTGVALRKENSRVVGELFADEAGRFVSLGAGDRLEAVLAAHGSGAVEASRSGGAVLNVDIGGGTTKFSLCEKGLVRGVLALDLGARLIVVDTNGIVVRLEESGRRIAQRCGLTLELGTPLTERGRELLAEEMTATIGSVIVGEARAESVRAALLTDPFPQWTAPEAIVVSGGVGEYFYRREDRDFGDLGMALGTAVRRRVEESGLRIAPSPAGIRATVVGAASYTVQVSGATIFVSAAAVLPLRNVPVIAPRLDLDGDSVPSAEKIEAGIIERLELLELGEHSGPIAVVMPWRGSVELERLDAIGAGILRGLAGHLSRGAPLILVWDDDVAGVVGRHLVRELGIVSPLISVDGIELREFDYVDIGALIEGSGSVPVTIKSLTFPGTAPHARGT